MRCAVSSENKLDARNPMAIVKNYIEEEGLRMLDFFKQMDKDHGGTISKEEFIEGLSVSARKGFLFHVHECTFSH